MLSLISPTKVSILALRTYLKFKSTTKFIGEYQKGKFIILKILINRAKMSVVVVKWSVYVPFAPTTRVRILRIL